MIRYDVIAKMETFSEDTQFTLSQAGLEGKLTVEWKHRTGIRMTRLMMTQITLLNASLTIGI